MPPRNVAIVFSTILLSTLCYAKTTRNHYARLVAQGMDVVARHALEEVEPRQLFENAMSGMVQNLDRYSSYIPPKEFEPFQEILDQEFGGIGIVLDTAPDTEQLTVLSPVAGTPAYRAGVRAGDQILTIDGLSTSSLKRDEAASKMRGKPGTVVTLGVKHVGDEVTQEITIERAIIEVPSVLGDTRDSNGDWKFMLEQEPRIGYIRIVAFGEKTVAEFKDALGHLPKDAEALIVDLRNNTGGLLTAAVDICDLFLESGVIVTTRGRHEEVRSRYEAAAGVSIPAALPMVVLANRYSASASEIVAACLQDHHRAAVVGERTWGKGTVQNIYPFERGRSAFKLTVATYWRPSNENIHRRDGAGDDENWGVRPDTGCDVTLTDEQFEAINIVRARRDILAAPSPSQNNGHASSDESPPETPADSNVSDAGDPQLQKAIEYLRAPGAAIHNISKSTAEENGP